MTRRTEIILSIAAALLFAGAAGAAVAPYIADVLGEAGIERSPVAGRTENGELRLLGTFKIYNPDTVPFYLWVSFDNGGKFTSARPGRRSAAAIRLVDLELRYRDASYRPMVKAFPGGGVGGQSPGRRRSGFGISGGGGGRFGKKGSGEGAAEAAEAGGRRARAGASEIVFWKEDVLGYYEMELWGVLYAPDVKEARAPGSYVENIKFEIEPAR